MSELHGGSTVAIEETADVAPLNSAGIRSKALTVGVITALTLLIGVAAAGVVLYVNVFSKMGGASSPEKAVERLLTGIEQKDSVAIYGVIAPDELYGLSDQPFDDALMEELIYDIEAVEAAYQQALDAVTIEFSNVELSTETFSDDLVLVEIVSGDVVIDIDIVPFVDSFEVILDNIEFMDLTAADRAEALRELEDMLYDTFPIETSVAELDMETSEGRHLGVFLMTVKIDGAWYVSPMMTTGEYIAQYAGVQKRGSMPNDLNSFTTPEDAAEAFIEGLMTTITRGRLSPVADTLASADQRFLEVYGPAFMSDVDFGTGGKVTIEETEFHVLETTRDTALVNIDYLSFTYTLDGDSVFVEWERGCLYADDRSTGDSFQFCMDELEEYDVMLEEYGVMLDEPALLVVRNGGGWTVTASGTLTHTMQAIQQQAACYYVFDGPCE